MKKHFAKSLPVKYEVIVYNKEEDQPIPYLLHRLQISQKQSVDLIIRHSKHSRKRAAQRSLSTKTLTQVLTFGTPYYRQGMTFYTVHEKDMPRHINHKEKEKLHNLVVVLGWNTLQMVTCYYATNSVKHLKRKGKELMKYKRA